jgi:hypothetical protein
MLRTGALERDPEFLKLWNGQTISQIGSRITRDSLPYTAVLMLHADPLQMGLLSALGGISGLRGRTVGRCTGGSLSPPADSDLV